jgi:hypothetical protein
MAACASRVAFFLKKMFDLYSEQPIEIGLDVQEVVIY